MSPRAPNTNNLNRSEFVPNTLPWLIGNRKQIEAADRPSAPTPEGGGRQSQSRADREKTPQPAPAAKLAAPRGSPIANKLGRHASHAWANIPIPHQAIHVRILSPPHPENLASLPAPPQAPQESPPVRPPTAWLSSTGDGSCSERGPHHNWFLVS